MNIVRKNIYRKFDSPRDEFLFFSIKERDNLIYTCDVNAQRCTTLRVERKVVVMGKESNMDSIDS
jgi:hypothetical protein